MLKELFLTMLYRGFYYSAKSAANGLLCLQGRVFAIRKAVSFIILTVVIFLLGFSKKRGDANAKKVVIVKSILVDSYIRNGDRYG